MPAFRGDVGMTAADGDFWTAAAFGADSRHIFVERIIAYGTTLSYVI